MIDEAGRLIQEPGEPCDFFAIRAFIVALNKIDDDRARAMIHYISDRGFSEIVKRKTTAAVGQAKEGK